MIQTSSNQPLAPLTSFGSGGDAENFASISKTDDILEFLQTATKPFWFLGSGANTLISDEGLPGTTIHLTTDIIDVQDHTLIADAGANWDTLVLKSLELGFWGLERTSGIPGSVGAAVAGNIAAYGQAVSDTLQWVDVIDVASSNPRILRMTNDELELKYRSSKLQNDSHKYYLIVRAAFLLADKPQPLIYASAVSIAQELELDPNNLAQRRQIILTARGRAGALWTADSANPKTAGSFFKNPLVTATQAEQILKYEEKNIAKKDIRAQNLIHGGASLRVSASHVMLAAGFKRGQSWGPVRLHPEHILKIENSGGASSTQIYEVAQNIIHQTKEVLGVVLKPEVRFLGKF